MSRRPPSDTFTRFTANSPHAAQSPSSTSFNSRPPSQFARQSPASNQNASETPRETPIERVARLRAAARAQRLSQFSTTDKIIATGRIWADRLHHATAIGLLGLTAVSAVVGAYGIFSLVSHNRRQKRAWIEREMDRLHQAQKAFLRGDANAEQLHLLEQERAGEEIAAKFKAEKEKKSKGVWSRMKGIVGKSAAAGEMGRETPAEIEPAQTRRGVKERLLEEPWIEGEIRPVAVAPSGIEGVGFDSKGRPVPANKLEMVKMKVEDERRRGEEEVEARTGITKGALDVMADNISTAVVPPKASGGWFSWARGGS